MRTLISIIILTVIFTFLLDHAVCSTICVEEKTTIMKSHPPPFFPRFRKRSILPQRFYHHPWNYRYGERFYNNPWRSHYSSEAYDYDRYISFDSKLTIECGRENKVPLPLVYPKKEYCTSCVETILTIKQLDGNFVPEGAFKEVESITELRLENLGIKYISEGAFEELGQCEKLYLSGNNISSLLQGVFFGLNQLETLDLSSNYISSVSNGIFNGLKKLTTLDLSKNKISSMSQGVFNRLNRLTQLDLSYNAIRDLKYLTFNTSKDTSIKLDLSHNHIDLVDRPILEKQFQNVSSLDLSFNDISYINFDDVHGKISSLDLSHNSISSISGCIYKISELILSHNNIKKLRNNCLNVTLRMYHLDVSYNRISELNFHSFPEFLALHELFLQYNDIRNISVGTFSNLVPLETVNLSNNKINSLPLGSFENLKLLESLDLSNNLLKKLNLNTFNSLFSLRNFYIQDNMISDFKYDKMTERFPKLTSINLNNNNFSCEFLIEVLFYLENNSVKCVYGTTKYSENVHGISCYSTLIIPEYSTETQPKKQKSVQIMELVQPTTDYDHQQIAIFWMSTVVMIVLLLILSFQAYFIHYKCQFRKVENVEMI